MLWWWESSTVHVVIILIITTIPQYVPLLTWLTPFTKWVHERVLSIAYYNAVTMTRLQFGIRTACPSCRSVCDIFSSRNLLFYVLVAISHLFALAIWSRNRLYWLWADMELMGWVWNRYCGTWRGWLFLEFPYDSGLYSAC